MTGTNIFNLNNSKAGMVNDLTLQQNTKSKSKSQETASVFASMMNQSANTTQTVGSNNSDDIGQSAKTTAKNTLNNAYDRYQYKQNQVEKSKNPSISDKIDSAKEELGAFEENVVDEIGEKLNVTDMDIQKVLDELGLTAFDLLNPKNLASLVEELTDATDAMELLTNGDFQELLGDIGQMGSDLMKQLDMQMEQMDELVMQMDALEEPQQMEIPDETIVTVESAVTPEENELQTVSQPIVEEANAASAKDTKESEKPEVIVEDLRETDDGQEAQSQIKAVESDGRETSAKNSFSKSDNENQSMMSDGQNVLHQDVENVAQTQEDAPVISYSDIDVMDMIEQVAKNVRVVLESDVTTMEMQLNPENLGKIYLNVSSKEGMVHAQLAAQNEAVKEALEMQLATLRENLSQAGIKVDAVEVTIASHEFERNLEQNEQGQEQNQNEEQKTPRRNLKIDSLDDLSGLMSEEEALVAQIMKDNGNSVDFTA